LEAARIFLNPVPIGESVRSSVSIGEQKRGRPDKVSPLTHGFAKTRSSEHSGEQIRRRPEKLSFFSEHATPFGRRLNHNEQKRRRLRNVLASYLCVMPCDLFGNRADLANRISTQPSKFGGGQNNMFRGRRNDQLKKNSRERRCISRSLAVAELSADLFVASADIVLRGRRVLDNSTADLCMC
jgi:hypothetical protein